MNAFLEKLMGLDRLNDQAIATDLLIAAKSGIKSYAIAISETASFEVRQLLTSHLQEAIRAHETITNYMINKGYYNAYDMPYQIIKDINNAQKTINT